MILKKIIIKYSYILYVQSNGSSVKVFDNLISQKSVGISSTNFYNLKVLTDHSTFFLKKKHPFFDFLKNNFLSQSNYLFIFSKLSMDDDFIKNINKFCTHFLFENTIETTHNNFYILSFLLIFKMKYVSNIFFNY